ncbi:SDR family NAD(P)-dependent oxidoreductase [Pseudonocardia kongjuensis]|uniref:SDR family NAD(P)-dependent oxidoreductase n=1 Tax=Pseudonocardia kongjuensis TaxID=102227 RepID=A0ABP4I410_9PSEU
MELRGATALVTGANRGFGRQLAVELVTRGATVYAAARRPELIDIAGVRPLRLDITDPGSVEAAARAAPDVDLLVNNAASTEIGNLVTGDPDVVRRMMDTHFHGTLAMIRAFAPVLAGNGGGAVLNVLSLVGWTSIASNTALAAAKSAQWGLTNGVRLELADQGTLVSGLFAGIIGTGTLREAMRDAGIELPSGVVNEPDELARLALDGIEAGEIEILDRQSAEAKAALSGPPRPFDPAAIASS